MQAVTCAAVALASAGGANKCKGYLLERRTDNLLDGEFWHCSECGRDVRPHSVPVPAAEGKKSLGDRNAGPQDIADEFKTLWSKGMAAMRFKVPPPNCLMLQYSGEQVSLTYFVSTPASCSFAGIGRNPTPSCSDNTCRNAHVSAV